MEVQLINIRPNGFTPEIVDGVLYIKTVSDLSHTVDSGQLVGLPTGWIIQPPEGYRLDLTQTNEQLKNGWLLENRGQIYVPGGGDEVILYLRNTALRTRPLYGGTNYAALVMTAFTPIGGMV